MSIKRSILFLDDEEKLLNLIKLSFEDKPYETFFCSQPGEALQILNSRPIDILVTDLKMPGITGMQILKQAKKINNDIEVVMMTAYASAETAVEAMKEGAYDYIIKPFKMDELILLVNRLAEKIKLKESNKILREELAAGDYKQIIGSSESLLSVIDRIKKVAASPVTVLIQGESGTGKELVARAIHNNSERRNNNYISVNCAAIPKDLIESELFGHEKGAFTGALDMRIGKFEYAQNGTIFLDEISELSYELQSKFLRILQEREFERVGGNQKIKVDVRVITATNKDLKTCVENGTFREDLFYRINVFPILIPPLRSRKDDIHALVRYFSGKHAKKLGFEPKEVTEDAMEVLLNYNWPGNVRELQNAIEHSCVLSENNLIDSEHLPEYLPRPAVTKKNDKDKKVLIDIPEAGINLEEVEKEIFQTAIRKARGNQSKAAKLLGITRRSLGYRLKKFGLE